MQTHERLGLDFSSFESSLPPQSVDAEEAILGGIMLDPGAMDRVMSLLEPEAFYIYAHETIYRACVALRSQRQPTDLMMVTTWLYDNGLLEKVGGQSKLVQLVDHTVSAVNVDRYAILVAEKYTRRRLIQAGHQIVQLGYRTEQTLDEVLGEAEQKIFALNQAKAGGSSSVELGVSIVNSYNQSLAIARNEATAGISTGFYDLDGMTGGFSRGDLVIAAGRPSMGKTAFMLNIARHVARSLPVIIFSLEMSATQLAQRQLAAESGVPSDRLRTGNLSDRDWEAATEALAACGELPIVINDDTTLTVSQMASEARRVALSQGGLGMIFVDYLQLMKSIGKHGNRVGELSEITRELKSMARELDVPVVVLSQLSRGVEARTNKRPMMSDLRDSGSIEQDADLILMLFRDEYYNPDSPDRGLAEIILSKHRNGPTGTIKLLFKNELTKFLNLQQRSY